MEKLDDAGNSSSVNGRYSPGAKSASSVIRQYVHDAAQPHGYPQRRTCVHLMITPFADGQTDLRRGNHFSTAGLVRSFSLCSCTPLANSLPYRQLRVIPASPDRSSRNMARRSNAVRPLTIISHQHQTVVSISRRPAACSFQATGSSKNRAPLGDQGRPWSKHSPEAIEHEVTWTMLLRQRVAIVSESCSGSSLNAALRTISPSTVNDCRGFHARQ